MGTQAGISGPATQPIDRAVRPIDLAAEPSRAPPPSTVPAIRNRREET